MKKRPQIYQERIPVPWGDREGRRWKKRGREPLRRLFSEGTATTKATSRGEKKKEIVDVEVFNVSSFSCAAL